MLLTLKRLMVLLGCLLCLNFVIGCKSEGPMERAGEQMDEAVEDTRDAGEAAGDRMEEMGEAAGDRMEEMGEATGEAIEETGEETREGMDRMGDRMQD